MRSWIWRISAVLVLTLGLAAGVAAQEPLSRTEFRDLFVAELARAAPRIKVEVVSESELKLIGADGVEKSQYLENAYRMYRNAPAALDDTVARFVRVAVAADSGERPPIDAGNAIVLVRAAGFVDDFQEAVRAKEGDPALGRLIHRPLPGGLVAIIAADEPDSYQYSPESEIVEALGPPDKAWKIALANTPRRIGKPEGEEVGALVLITTPEGGASSLLAIDDFWLQLEKSGLGAPVVLATSRDSLVIAFEGRKDSVRDLKLVARGMVEEPGEFDEPMLSSALLAWRNGRWELYAEYPYQ